MIADRSCSSVHVVLSHLVRVQALTTKFNSLLDAHERAPTILLFCRNFTCVSVWLPSRFLFRFVVIVSTIIFPMSTNSRPSNKNTYLQSETKMKNLFECVANARAKTWIEIDFACFQTLCAHDEILCVSLPLPLHQCIKSNSKWTTKKVNEWMKKSETEPKSGEKRSIYF